MLTEVFLLFIFKCTLITGSKQVSDTLNNVVTSRLTFDLILHFMSNKNNNKAKETKNVFYLAFKAGLKLIQGHHGHGLGCPFDWPQCPSHWPWRFCVPFPILPMCAVL